MVCEGDEFDENKASRTRVKAPPFHFREMKVATTYTVAVRLISEQGFLSSLSEVNMIQIPLGLYTRYYLLSIYQHSSSDLSLKT